MEGLLVTGRKNCRTEVSEKNDYIGGPHEPSLTQTGSDDRAKSRRGLRGGEGNSGGRNQLLRLSCPPYVRHIVWLRNLNEQWAAFGSTERAVVRDNWILESGARRPTPLIDAVVLPDGHKPPTAPGGAVPNFDEVPPHLRAYAQALTPVPISTPAPAQVTRLQIPALNVDASVLHGTDWEQLKLGVGHSVGTANPGERGNLVLAAHNDVYGELFRYLDQLNPGDEVITYAGQQRYRYVIIGSRIVKPTQVEVMLPTSEPTLTLISCYPYLIDTERIIVFGQLQS